VPDDADADDLYDDGTWALIERWNAERVQVPAEVAHGWRAGMGATALYAAAMLGVQDVLEPERRTPIIEEIDLDAFGQNQWVTYHHMPGAPRLSRAVVRPWLAPR